NAAVATGRFRGDLFYRLNVVPISVPPLRARDGDVELLVQFLVHKLTKKLGRPAMTIPAQVMKRLRAYAWPGNVRELQNVMERAIVLGRDGVLALGPEFALAATTPAVELAPAPSAAAVVFDAVPPTGASLNEVERQHIQSVLVARNWMIEGERGA